MYIVGIRRIRMTRLSEEMLLRIGRGSKRVVLEMVFHSTCVKTAGVSIPSSGTNQDSVSTRMLGCMAKYGEAIL
jgi:hypothetical protein